MWGSLSGGLVEPKNSFDIRYDESLGESDIDYANEKYTLANWGEDIIRQ
jgi:hypothetical protein